MERFLLFDSGCSVCTGLAHAIETSAGGRLKARSLRDPEMKALLDRARPDWRWEPTILEVNGHHARAFTGIAMRLWLLAQLGPRRTWRVAQLVRKAGVPLVEINSTRREFLAGAGKVFAGMALIGINPSQFSNWLNRGPSGSPPSSDDPVSVGPAAWALGVRSYKVKQSENRVDVSFTHVDKSKEGRLNIQATEIPNGKKLALGLERGARKSLLTWDTAARGLEFADSSNRSAKFSFNGKEWVAANDQAPRVMEANYPDLRLMSAIATDFPIANPAPRNTPRTTSAEATPDAICCDYGVEIIGQGWGWLRSEACTNATSDANFKCSNGLCIGCCTFLSDRCDCACVYGDVSCYCLRTGRPCMSC